jgi:site-specific recombinase XerD
MSLATEATSLHHQFLQHGRILRGWSPRTVQTYAHCLRAFGDTPLTKAGLANWIVALRERGHTKGGVNVLARTVNSYLSWLREEGHLTDRLRIKLLPSPPKAITAFSDVEVRRIVSYRPHGRPQTRTWTLIVLLLDTGLRIDEALGLERQHVNIDQMYLRVMGKGARERLVPISTECRKILYRWLSRSESTLVFTTRSQGRVSYRNAYRDVKALCAAMGVTGRHVHPHAFRHCFAASYVRRGGDVYRLSRILGHSTITTTQLYLRSMGIEHLQEGHAKYSPLSPIAGGVR